MYIPSDALKEYVRYIKSILQGEKEVVDKQ